MLYLSTVALLAAAGCGGDAAEPSAEPCVASSEVTADVGRDAPGTAIAISALDDRFEPGCVEVTPDAALTIVVRNDGRHPHDLTLPGGESVAVDAGQVAILDTTVAADGIRYTCTIHPGMDGEIRTGP